MFIYLLKNDFSLLIFCFLERCASSFCYYCI